jgi:hypothetical protein
MPKTGRKVRTAQSFRVEIKCIEECATRLNAIADNDGDFKESLDLLAQTLRITSKNALALLRLMGEVNPTWRAS